MPVDLHLLSLPGVNDISYILEACQPYLEKSALPSVAFIQWASVNHDWLPYTQKSFDHLAQVEALNFDPDSLAENRAILDRCSAVYISGGNTYLLNHRVHESGIFEHLRALALAGLPIVGFSAGAMLCGPNILTTHDINMLPTGHFNGLDLIPYNIAAHYPEDDALREDEDDWLSDYHALHTNPILALENDAYARWDGQTLRNVHGTAWVMEPAQPRAMLA